MIEPADVIAAQERIRGRVVRTPLVPSATVGRQTGVPVLLKPESLQPTGSFKLRGAASRLLGLDPRDLARGVVTASTGNHGRAVAYVARQLGAPATVCVSEHVPAGKRDALTALGCDLRVVGDSQTAALAAARRLADEEGMTLVHPFEDAEVVAGQGTIGLEVAEDVPELACVLVPLSGGGLLGGIAVAIRAERPDIRLVGVSMRRGAAMAASLEAGRPVELAEAASLADSLQGGVGQGTFELVRDLVDDVVLIDEGAIWDGMRYAFEEHRLLLEGAGAVGIGALLAGSVGPVGPTVVVCSGANLEREHLESLAAGVESAPLR